MPVPVNARTMLAGCLLLLSLPAFGQLPKPGWIADDRTGCKVWDRNPRPNQSVAWSGTCRNGKAHGRGGLDWFNDGKLAFHFEGMLSGGRLNGRAVETLANGDRVEGTFRDGNATGHGLYWFASGAHFDGQLPSGRQAKWPWRLLVCQRQSL